MLCVDELRKLINILGLSKPGALDGVQRLGQGSHPSTFFLGNSLLLLSLESLGCSSCPSPLPLLVQAGRGPSAEMPVGLTGLGAGLGSALGGCCVLSPWPAGEGMEIRSLAVLGEV